MTRLTNLIEMSLNGWNKYFGGSLFRWLFTIGLILLVVVVLRSEKREEKKRASFLLSVALMGLVVIFCPVSAWVIKKMVGEKVYWRTMWILPVVPVTVWLGVWLISSGRKLWMKGVTGLLVVAAIVVCGKSVLNENYFSKNENPYKLESHVIEVADLVQEHAQSQGVSDIKLLSPYSLSTYIRIYDAGIGQYYGRNTTRREKRHKYLFREVNATEEHDYKKLARRARKKGVNYIALHVQGDGPAGLAAYDFVLVGETPDYRLYFDARWE
ncbi:MAG: hypothetical protein Q4B59_02560 [Lachnospiraceae bacterium]|nr:hypothetical protein [Lachnospiraceae bacterium]